MVLNMLATKTTLCVAAGDSQIRYVERLSIDLPICVYGEEFAEVGRVYVRRSKSRFLQIRAAARSVVASGIDIHLGHRGNAEVHQQQETQPCRSGKPRQTPSHAGGICLFRGDQIILNQRPGILYHRAPEEIFQLPTELRASLKPANAGQEHPSARVLAE